MTITTTWDVPYASSGGPGNIGPIGNDTTYSYDVNEIQTRGTGS